MFHTLRLILFLSKSFDSDGLCDLCTVVAEWAVVVAKKTFVGAAAMVVFLDVSVPVSVVAVKYAAVVVGFTMIVVYLCWFSKCGHLCVAHLSVAAQGINVLNLGVLEAGTVLVVAVYLVFGSIVDVRSDPYRRVLRL